LFDNAFPWESDMFVERLLRVSSNLLFLGFVTASALMTIFCGCATKQVVVTAPEKPYDSRTPTEWHTLHTEPSDASLRISLDFQVENGSSLRVVGEVISCSYMLNTREERQIPTQRYNRSLNQWEQRWEREVRDKLPKRENWLPQQLEVANSYGSNGVVRVNANGHFSGTITFDRISYSSADRNRNKYKTFRTVQPREPLVFRALDPPVSLVFDGRATLPSCWEAVPNYDAAREYVESRLANVHIDFRDQGTRLRLMPKVVLTTISPSKEEIMRELSTEFYGDADLLRSAEIQLEDMILGGQTYTSISDQIEFAAWDRGRYQIETTLGGYHYFKTIIECNRPGQISKEILLVDRGSKIRIENVEEGSVGSITDKP